MKNLKDLTIVAILLFVFWRFFTPLSPRVASDFPYIYPEYLNDIFDFPQTWSGVNLFGVNASPFLWGYLNNLIYALANKLGLDFALIQRLVGFLPVIIIGVFSINKFLRYLKVSGEGLLIGSIFYLTSTYFLLLIDGGQFLIAGAYAIFPYAYISFEKALSRRLKEKVLAGVAISLLGFFDIRFIYILGALLVLRFFYEFLFLTKTKLLSWIVAWIKTIIISSIIIFGLHAFWLLPTILIRPESPEYAVEVLGETLFNIGHVILFQQPQWYENVFGVVSNLRASFILIPLLAFAAPLLVRRNKSIGFWTLTALAGIFLAKGTSGVLGEVYSWLFENIPGFNIFRDSTKFFFVIALSYSFLIGVSVNKLTKVFTRLIEILGKKILIVTPIIIVGFLLLVRPVWLGKTVGTFSTNPELSKYKQAEEYFRSDSGFGRIYWIPSRHPLGYASPAHPVVEALRISYLRPFVTSAVGKFEFLNFIREATFMGEIFDILGIKYIAYPYPDERGKKLKEDEREYYFAFSDQISQLPWIEKKIFDFPLNVYKTKKSQDHFFIAPNTFYIVGSDRIYWDLVKLAGFELSKNALVFVEEFPEIIKNIPDHAQLILYEKDAIDLAMSFLSRDNFIFPAKDLSNDPGSSGWWKRETKDFLWWRDFLQQKYKIDNQDFDYSGGWAIAEGNRELGIRNEELGKGKLLFARVMISSGGGKVEFWQGAVKIGEVSTLSSDPGSVHIKLTGYKEIQDQIFEYDKADFKWFEVGELIEDGTLTIKTSGEINVVNSFVSVSKVEWANALQEVEKSKSEGRIYNWEETADAEKVKMFESHNNSIISYQRLSPTHYKVKIGNLDLPATLVFSEAYDSLWTFDGKYSTKIYSLINGFSVKHNGEYDVYFEPQKYVLPGLLISGAVLAAIAGYFLYNFISAKKNPRH